VVVHRGDPGNHLYLILRGRLKVTLPSAHGEGLLVAVLEAGEAFGELAFMDGRPQPFTVTAAKPTELLALRREELEPLAHIRSSLESELLATLYEQLRDAYEAVEDVVYLDVAGRLAKRLLKLAERYGRETPLGVMIGLPLTQGDLAAMLGVTRETVNKHLKIFRSRGLINLQAQRLIVRRPEELRRRIY
jgi:CRP-like cAMP-binding protein